MTPLLPLLMFATMPVLIYTFVLYDRLVRTEYEHHRKAWLDDGEPAGMLWSPSDWQHSCSWIARSRVMILWLFKTPPWVAESDSRALLSRYRIFYGVAFVMILLFIAGLNLSR